MDASTRRAHTWPGRHRSPRVTPVPFHLMVGTSADCATIVDAILSPSMYMASAVGPINSICGGTWWVCCVRVLRTKAVQVRLVIGSTVSAAK